MPYTEDGFGHKVTDTSAAAAHSASRGRALLIKQGILDTLRIMGPLTCDELQDLIPAAEGLNHIRPRITNLKDMALIEDTGFRRELHSGKNGIVWGLTTAGRHAELLAEGE